MHFDLLQSSFPSDLYLDAHFGIHRSGYVPEGKSKRTDINTANVHVLRYRTRWTTQPVTFQ